MVNEGLICAGAGSRDGRQKLVRLTPKGIKLLPKLEAFWEVTALAAANLEADLPFPLAQTIDHAIKALTKKPFEARITEARAELSRAPRPRSQR
jgi:DNA-binding MarR family transcriptional regulator